MRLVRITISTMIAVAAFLAFTASAAHAAAPCPPGEPYGQVPGGPNGILRPQYPPSKCALALSASVVAAGGSVTAQGSGYQPASTVNTSLDTRSTGSATADRSGNFTHVINVPADMAPGSYTVRATGVGASGAPFEQAALLEVLPANTDPAKVAARNDALRSGAGLAAPAGGAAAAGTAAAVSGEVASGPLPAPSLAPKLAGSSEGTSPFLYLGAAAVLAAAGASALVVVKKRKATKA